VLWGRRRVGKTRLLLEWCRDHGGLYTVADLSAEAVQRRFLAEAVAQRFPSFAEVTYDDWSSLLRALTREATRAGWRGPLVLDELPYLVEGSPPLPTVLQRWLDHDAAEARLVVAVAGSTQHMMHGLALASDAPLFGRAREAMALQPMPVGAAAEALGLDEPVDAVRAYAAWGGIPRYWELAEPFVVDLEAAVDRLVLDPLGPLHREPERLLLEERPPAVSLRPLLDVIGAGAHRLSEIAARLGQPATSLSRPLARLVELGLVRREQPFGAPERSGKRSLYRIADPFVRLWFRTVAPNRSALAAAPADVRRTLFLRVWPALLAQTWEELCRQAVPRLGLRSGSRTATASWGPAGRAWSRDQVEWDVVARSLDGASLLLGEAKWRDAVVGAAEVGRLHRELLARPEPQLPDPPQQVVHAVFVPRCTPAARRLEGGPLVLEAADVVGALR